MGIGLVNVVGIVGGALAAHQARAVIEHLVGSGHGISVPPAAGIDGSQIAAAREHFFHAAQVGGIEAAQVKFCQTRAVSEHAVRYVQADCVEAAQVKFRQTRAASEHVSHVDHVGGVEVAQVKLRQTRAASEHAEHIEHLGCVEATHVKACQGTAVSEHPTHVGHLAGVQVADACNGLKFGHFKEPTLGGCRADVGKRRVEDHLGHIGIGAIGVPTGIIAARVQVIGRARAGIAQGIVVERERRVRRCVAGISHSHIRIGQITRVARAAVDMGVGLVLRVRIIKGRALTAHQAIAK